MPPPTRRKAAVAKTVEQPVEVVRHHYLLHAHNEDEAEGWVLREHPESETVNVRPGPGQCAHGHQYVVVVVRPKRGS